MDRSKKYYHLLIAMGLMGGWLLGIAVGSHHRQPPIKNDVTKHCVQCHLKEGVLP